MSETLSPATTVRTKTKKKKNTNHECNGLTALFWAFALAFCVFNFSGVQQHHVQISNNNDYASRSIYSSYRLPSASSARIHSERNETVIPSAAFLSMPLPYIAPILGEAPPRALPPMALAWKVMIQDWNVHSVLELSPTYCGIATAWFRIHGVNSAQCVVPAHDPDWPYSWQMEHDFRKGPWWPYNITYDAILAPDMLLTDESLHETNVLPSFRSAAIILVSTFAKETADAINEKRPLMLEKLEQLGLKRNMYLTDSVRAYAALEWNHTPAAEKKSNGLYVFLNPAVASMPEHAHLFMEHGCFAGRRKEKERAETGLGPIVNRVCSSAFKESELPSRFYPISLTRDMDQEWELTMRQKLMGTAPLLSSSNIAKYISNKKELKWVNSEPSLQEKKLSPWEIPNPEPSVPPGFTSESFWEMIYERAQNSSLLPDIWVRQIQQRNYDKAPMPIIPIVHWPMAVSGSKTAEHRHVFLNGMRESRHVELILNVTFYEDPNLLWIAEPGFGWNWDGWCDELTNVVKKAIVERYKLGLSTRWPIFIPDFTDGWGKQRCLYVEKLIGFDLVTYSARSMVRGRYFNKTKEWVEFGNATTDFTDSSKKMPPLEVEQQVRYTHIPLVVRTDTVENLERILKRQGKDLSFPIETLPRPDDIAHYWPVGLPKKGHGVSEKMAKFRFRVSNLLYEYAKELGWKGRLGLAGAGQQTGRRSVSKLFITSMMQTKIVVVTQRDTWEDHYRLMEALVSGALVVTDYMNLLPGGLQNGTSILMFTTPEDLKSLITYYLEHEKERLEIAKRGREVAMFRHRSWHRVEEIVFGEIRTTCAELASTHPTCPYMVHTSANLTLEA